MTGSAPVFVHPDGLCESDDVGAGTRVWAFAHVLAGAVVGAGCNICDGVFIESGAVLGDNVTVKNGTLVFDRVTCENDVFLGPNVLFTNDLRPRSHVKRGSDELLSTLVRRGATLGAGTVVVCGVTVGEYAFAGAGSVIIADVPAYAFVAGNPAVRRGWVCACGARLDERLRCASCGSGFSLASEASGLCPEPLGASREPRLSEIPGDSESR